MSLNDTFQYLNIHTNLYPLTPKSFHRTCNTPYHSYLGGPSSQRFTPHPPPLIMPYIFYRTLGLAFPQVADFHTPHFRDGTINSTKIRNFTGI